MLVNSLGYDNNFENREWNDKFRKKYIPPSITPPKENSSPPNSSSSPNPSSSPNFSLPPHRNQSSQRKSPSRNYSSPRNSPHSPPPAHNPSSYSYLSDEFRILKISVSSSWREIKTPYHKLARVYHPDKYDNFLENNFSRGRK